MRPIPRGAAALLVLLTACGSSAVAGRESGKTGKANDRSKSAASPAPAKTFFDSRYDEVPADRGPQPSPSLPPDMVLTPGPDGEYHIPTFVYGQVPEEESWEGATCAPPKPGSICKVHFIGTAYSNADTDTLWLMAYENGSAKAVVSGGPIPMKREYNRINYFLRYQVSSGAKYVTFKMQLRNAAGKVIAENRPQRYPIVTT